MPPRSRVFPPDNITHGEALYLERRYPDADEFKERRERITATLKRLVRKGRQPEQLHRALMLGAGLWQAHADRQMNRKLARQQNSLIARAQRDLNKALTSLRRLLPPGVRDEGRFPFIDDDFLLQLRDKLLLPVTVTPPKRPSGGRPWEWKQATEDALRKAGVGASDRRELLAALGFVGDTDSAPAE